MSFAGKLARGVLQGLGGYYGEQAKLQAEERRAQILADREMALARFSSGLRREEATHAAQESRTSYADKVATDVAGEVAVLGPKTEATIRAKNAAEQAEFATWKAKQPIELRNQLTIEDFRQDRQDSRTAMQEDRQDARQQRGFEEDVVATGVDVNGQTVVMKGNDSIVRFQGVKPKLPTAEDDGSILDQVGRGGRPVLSPRPKSIVEQFGGARRSTNSFGGEAPATSGSAEVDYTEFQQLLADAAMDARFKGKPPAQIRREIIELARRNNIAAPDR